MIDGSRPAWADDTILAMGFTPRLTASDWLIRTVAAAPSLIPWVKKQNKEITLYMNLDKKLEKHSSGRRRLRKRWRTSYRTWCISRGDSAAVLNEAGFEFGHAVCVAAVTRKLIHLHLHRTWRWKTDDTVHAHKGQMWPFLWGELENKSLNILPCLVDTVTGTISWSKCPAFCAASVLFWDWTANRSCCSRLTSHCFATFSADKIHSQELSQH